MSDFYVVAGKAVQSILDEDSLRVKELVSSTYKLHDRGKTINPPSYFLRFPNRPSSRIIALPASISGSVECTGIKWISSFPQNLERGLPRASAVLILNDHETGQPVACLDAARISAARTAASATIAAEQFCPAAPITVGIVGSGVIARTILRYLMSSRLDITSAKVHDLDDARAVRFSMGAADEHKMLIEAGSLDECLSAELVVFATTAASPYVDVEYRFNPGQVILNVSLRDLPAEIILASTNVVDDVDHCLTADTSPHLAEKLSGSRDFVRGTIGEVLNNSLSIDHDIPVIFSPFGLGVLDLAVGDYVLQRAQDMQAAVVISGFNE